MKYPCVDLEASYVAPWKLTLARVTTMNVALADEHEETLGEGTVEAELVSDRCGGMAYVARNDPRFDITRDGCGVYALFDLSDGMIFRITIDPVNVFAGQSVTFQYNNRRIVDFTPRTQ